MPLQVIQELLDAVQVEQESDYTSSEEDSEAQANQVVMAVKPADLPHSSSGQPRRNRTLRLKGWIGSQEVLILLDSGSAGSFVSQELAIQITQKTTPCEPIQFTFADGNLMLSNTIIQNMQWHVQGHSFIHDIRVLPLKCYDMVLGANWLEEQSPMWIH